METSLPHSPRLIWKYVKKSQAPDTLRPKDGFEGLFAATYDNFGPNGSSRGQRGYSKSSIQYTCQEKNLLPKKGGQKTKFAPHSNYFFGMFACLRDSFPTSRDELMPGIQLPCVSLPQRTKCVNTTCHALSPAS
eukprot:704127-Amphidinium_carterae.1